MSALDSEGIISGIKKDVIQKLLDDKNYNNPTKIAEGEKPQRGKNSEFTNTPLNNK